jgi:hypothetical protein
VKIKVERSGGFAGIPSSIEMDSDKLPSSIIGKVRELLDNRKLPSLKNPGRHKSAADYLNYKITIQNGKKNHVIECSELEMDDNVKSLVNYLQKNSKK